MSTVTSTCGEEHCITCGDVAVQMCVIEIDSDGTLALCAADSGERQTVDVTLVAPVRIAERLLVHAGTAISRGGGAL
jgi:hydrogenase maturation factor